MEGTLDKSKHALTELVTAADALINESPEAVHMFVDRLSACFNEGGKLLIAGLGENGPIANMVAMRFQHRTSLDRPLLPAISINQNSDLASVSSKKQLLSKQVQLNAQEGNFFLILADVDDPVGVSSIIEMARAAGCITALLFPGEPDVLSSDPDFFFYLPAQSATRRSELSLFFGQHLCELVEGEIFGF
jgi:D-sedoheptulose 7-phosphate isomerase